MDRVFLDANVIFSAAYRPSSGIRQLWSQSGVVLVSSLYALEEARRNLLVHMPSNISVLDELVESMAIVSGLPSEASLPARIDLAEKDVPILAAAIGANCTHLLTGDKQHFGALYGKSVGGVLVLTPADYVKQSRPLDQ